jgi:acyl-CoA thioesterase FadM
MGADLAPADFARLGIAAHLRREIASEECDADGFFAPSPPKITARNGVYNQGIMDQVWGTVPGFAWPALEMRTLMPRTPRRGDVLETYSALLSVGHKVMQSGFWTFEARSGALVAVMQQVNIFFELAARRAQDMPADVRERLTRLATPGLIGSRTR